MDTFATRLKYARERAGLNQSELARRIGIKPQSIQHIESGSTQKSRYTLEIANVLGVSVEWLVYGEGSIEPTENALIFRENITELQRRFLAVDTETQNWIAELLMGSGNKDVLILIKMLKEIPESQRQVMRKTLALLTQLES